MHMIDYGLALGHGWVTGHACGTWVTGHKM